MLDQPARPKRHKRPAAAEIRSDTPIWCPWCETEHPASAFNKETRRYSGLSTICREAQAAKRKTPEQRGKTAARDQRRWADPDYRARSRVWRRERRQRVGSVGLKRARRRLQDIVDDWKRAGCIDCGYDGIHAIDPDHLDGESKVGHISRMVQLCASAERIRTELAKCVPRCARCHRKRTAAQRVCQWRARNDLPPSWRRRLKRQDINDAIKLGRACVDCGWAGWARGLDWDHVSGQKVAGIATLIANGRPWVETLAEMAKCEVVCANCHRLRTRQRRRSKPIAARPSLSPE